MTVSVRGGTETHDHSLLLGSCEMKHKGIGTDRLQENISRETVCERASCFSELMQIFL